ncbi:hypothetical protein AB0I22_38990 [Streptomyces sp. NPDC050610]
MDRVRAVASCTAGMPLDAVGRTAALERLDEETAEYERLGRPGPT